MATLTAISFNLAGSVGVFSATMVAFGVAIKNQNTFVAARCTGRPRTVIHNPDPYRHPSQDRGHPMLGWVVWVMKLTYGTMLQGVPGTGTRDGGLSGSLLQVNLDGIVLLRFHHLCLRVCMLATLLHLVVVLPLYSTAQCSRIQGDQDSDLCLASNLTDYQRLTLANLPALGLDDPQNAGDVISGWFLPDNGGILARLYAVVLVTWIVTYYTLQQLQVEWADVLAMRRVYYLEADHWNDRKEELEQTLLRAEREKLARRNSDHTASTSMESDESYLTDRPPWIPHPEQRDTVPNIELYSVLVGGLPSLPTQAVDHEGEAIFSRKQSIDWQLAVTTAFFDHCVPNQPGFSSSIAAVTILPSAQHLTEAWDQWYKVAGKLRRLRFIRKWIAKRRQETKIQESTKLDDMELGKLPNYFPKIASQESTLQQPAQRIYAESPEKHEYYKEVLGSSDDIEVESRLIYALHFGPEQTASYSREFALGAANLAPYGWGESRIKNAPLEELLRMEQLAVSEVNDATAALRAAQERIAEDESLDPNGVASDEELGRLMRDASFKGLNSSHTSFGDLSYEEDLPADASSPNGKGHILYRRSTSQSSDSVDSFFEDSECKTEENTTSTPGESDNSRSIDSTRNETKTMSNSAHDLPLQTSGGRMKRRRSSLLGGMTSLVKSGLTRKGSDGVEDEESGQKKKPQKANLASAQLPSDLGLEAGLWMESMHGMQRASGAENNQLRRSRSTVSNSHGSIHTTQENFHRAPPRRTRSSDQLDDAPVQKNKRLGPPRRSHSSAGVDLKPDKEDAFRQLSRFDPFIALELEKLLRNGGQQDESKTGTGNSASSKVSRDDSKLAAMKKRQSDAPSKTAQDLTSTSIWEKLQEDKERKDKLRQRLTSIRNADKVAEDTGENMFEASASKLNRAGIDPDNSCSEDSSCSENSSCSEDSESLQTGYGREDATEMSREQQSQLGVKDMATNEARRDQRIEDDSIDTNHSLDLNAIFSPAAANDNNEIDRMESQNFPDGSSSSWTRKDNQRICLDFEEKAGLRHRETVTQNHGQEAVLEKEDKWSRVVEIVQESSRDKKVHDKTMERMISSGSWMIPTFASIRQTVFKQIRTLLKGLLSTLKPPEIVDDLVRDSSYAVVTFTSRQAAVAARNCLADSRGHDRWKTVCEIPSPPLADAPVFQMSSFRGCVRPVTLSISDKQKLIRRSIAFAALVTIYFFYTIPLIAAQELVSPESLSKIFPDIQRLQESSVFLSNLISGFIPAMVWTAFFAVCPPMFKVIANFGSNATSSVTAENSALHYFWWFMMLSAFTGTSFSQAFINGFNSGLNLGVEIKNVIESTAQTIPAIVSANWLNWMIVRTFAVLPTQYLLQLNTFIFSGLGLKCCARTVRGGGAGGPIPYRIYVDSGVVMLCLSALAPASPLIAPAAFLYFLFCTPMLRWTIIFLYRPKFDVGGGRFPFIFDICVSGMVLGQILLVTMMTLKGAIGPAVLAFFPMIPTIWFRHFVRSRYLRAFNDPALLQTSLLDGWDTNEPTSQEKREEFRRFLVDCHKAAYVPVCIAGDETMAITAEPALVVANEIDEDFESVRSIIDDDGADSDTKDVDNDGGEEEVLQRSDKAISRVSGPRRRGVAPVVQQRQQQPLPNNQMGAMMRRATAMARQHSVALRVEPPRTPP